MANKMLRLPGVKEQTGLSRSAIYRRIANKTFPQPVPLGGRAVGWLENDVQEWIDECLKESRTRKTKMGDEA